MEEQWTVKEKKCSVLRSENIILPRLLFFFFFFFKLNISCDFTGARTRPHMRTQTAVQFDHTQ